MRHHRKSLRFYSEFIRSGDLCFDIGANVGEKTELFLSLGAKVVSVEPQQACVKELQKRFRENENVVVVPQAVTDTEGYAELVICEEAPSISTMSNKWKSEGRFATRHDWTITEKVPTTTLDALIKQHGLPMFCKIDVEGFELPVLRGLTKPIPFISFEFSKEFIEEMKQCIDLLLTLGPAEFNFSLGESMELAIPCWVTPRDLYAKLTSLGGEFLQGDIYIRFV